MSTLADLLPSVDAALALEPEELAGLALELIEDGERNGPSRLHPSGFSHPDTIGGYPQELRGHVAKALMEAWNWMIQAGILAPTGDNQWHFVTRRGRLLKDRAGVAKFRNTVLLPRQLLHPVIEQRSWSAFLRGDYDTAVFQAFKEVEIQIRKSSNAGSDDYGVKLARFAFHTTTGPLTNLAAPEGEREALMHLMSGALGSYKNPHSHRRVELEPTETVEMLILASHLYKITESRAPGDAA